MHLAAALRDRGADEVEVVEVPRESGLGGYVFARYGTPRTLINAHVDTVPAQPAWRGNPFVAEIADDRVTGLGAADTKGAIAAVLTALERTEPRDVGILFSGDEERGTTCMQAFLASARAADAPAAALRRAIVCEPTNRCAGVRHRGINSYRSWLDGRGGHSSQADHMPKPIVAMARLAVELDELGRSYLDVGPADMQGLCMNVARIDGGVAFNVVPESAQLTWSVRPPPGFDRAAFDQALAEAIARVDAGIGLAEDLAHPPFECRDQEAFAELLGDSVSGFVPLDLWTEAALFANAGIDAVVIGPGDSAQAHAADEYVTRADLDWAVELYARVLAGD
jgi:acetylornithine deacetylase